MEVKIEGIDGATWTKIPAKIRREIEAAITLRATAKGMEIEAKTMTETAKSTLLPLMTAYEIKSYSIEGVGKVMSKTNRGSAINAKKLTEALLLEGMDTAKINRIIKKSSTTWRTEYVDFVGAK